MDTRLKRAGAALLLALALLPRAMATASVEDQAGRLAWWGDFEGLSALYQRAAQPGPAGTEAGTLWEFRRGVRLAFKGRSDSPDAYFEVQQRLTAEWARQHPDSPLAQVLHARALYARAWGFRGTGYASAVPPDAWEGFRRHVQLALEHLVKHREVAFRITFAHSLLIDIALSQGWGVDRAWAIAEEGLKLEPDDTDLYNAVLFHALPKWGGSPQQVDQLVRRAAEHSRARRGEEMYARLYSEAADGQFEHALFEQTGAQWPRMKQGFEDLLKRRPTTAWRSRYAYFACLARDKPVFLDQMERLGDEVVTDRWGAHPARTLETCRQWGAQQ